MLFEDKNNDGLILEDPTNPQGNEVLQRELYYPFGLQLRGTAPLTPGVKQQYLYNGKELDETGLYAYGFRYYDPATGRFTGVDPIADQFAFVSGYNYAENRVPNAIDLWGLQAFLVHGTSSDPSRWNNLKTIEAIKIISGNSTVNSKFDWSELSGPFNNQTDRAEAANSLAEHVLANLMDGESITLVGHSHGGNVAIQAINIIRKSLDEAGDSRKINLITISTPSYNGENDPENPSNAVFDKHTHIYNNIDGVQNDLANVAGSKPARRYYKNSNTNNVELDVADQYTTFSGSQYGVYKKIDKVGAHSFDVQYPEIIINSINNGVIKKH